jgi:hypothetical protein
MKDFAVKIDKLPDDFRKAKNPIELKMLIDKQIVNRI